MTVQITQNITTILFILLFFNSDLMDSAVQNIEPGKSPLKAPNEAKFIMHMRTSPFLVL